MTLPDDRVVERIRKLLALATSSNPHEAAAAAERAVELAQRHNLDLATLPSRENPYVEESVDVGGGSAWRWLLMSAVARAHFCAALRAFGRGRAGGTMLIIGQRHNVTVCVFLFTYLAREIERLAARGWRRAHLVYGEHVVARAWKNDFRRGAVITIDERLKERTRLFAAESGAARALVISQEADLRAEIERRHPNPRVTTLRSRGGDAYSTGRSIANDIRLADALDGGSRASGRSLSAPGLPSGFG